MVRVGSSTAREMKLDFSTHTNSKGGSRLILCLIFGLCGSAVHAFDLNGDGVINILDVSLVASCYGLDPVTYPQCQVADVISDGLIDMLDVSAVASCYGLDPATNPQCQLPDNEAPLPADTSLISVTDLGGGSIEVAGFPGSVEGNSTVSLANFETGATATTSANADGSFMVTLAAVQGQVFSITVVDSAGNASGPVSVGVGQMLALTVSSPTIGAAIADDRVLVTGTFSTPPNSAVTVNGQVAATSGNQFYASSVPLVQGQNTLSITLASVDGLRVTETLTVTSTGAASVQVTATPEEGLGPLDVSFTLEVTGAINVQLVEVDFDGDGAIDFTGTALPAELNFNYANPGVYGAVFTITDDTATEYITTETVAVADSTVLDADLRSVFKSMTDRLQVGAIDGALNQVSGGAYEKYRDIFLSLQNDLSTVVDQLGTLSTATLGLEMAEILVIRTVGAEQKAFPIYFLRGADGIWRIDGM